MDNVPVRVNGPAPTGRNTPSSPTNAARGGKQSNNKIKTISLAAAVATLVLVLALIGWFLYRSSLAAHIDSDRYQAVFFTNGQVYFGKLEKLNGNYFKLNDIFYLQAQSDSEATNESENPQQTSNQQSSDVQLIKLGSEVHGPEDEMIMSKDQILFFENLKTDGKVTDSIGQYYNQNKQ